MRILVLKFFKFRKLNELIRQIEFPRKVGQYWILYNKIDTKLRENEGTIMPRKTFDKAFKLAAVKLILEEEQSVENSPFNARCSS